LNPDDLSSPTLRKSLRKSYGQARSGFENAKSRATPTLLHDWRKKTKYLHNAIDILGQRRASKCRALGRRAHRLGDQLGEEHDLVVLLQTLRDDSAAVPASVRRDLTLAISRRRYKLQKKALRLGAKTYAWRPKKAIP